MHIKPHHPDGISTEPSTKTAPSQPSHLLERLYLIPRGIGRETVRFKRRYEGWGGGGRAKGKGERVLRFKVVLKTVPVLFPGYDWGV